jgi:hypothetical protein
MFDPLGLDKAVVSGGVNEDIEKDPSHDKNWRNFIDSAKIQLEDSAKDLAEGEELEWYVQKSSYENRAANDGEWADSYTSEIEKMASDLGANLKWYESADDLANLINNKSGDSTGREGAAKITRLDFFGHGAGETLMTKYLKNVINVSDVDNGLINSGAFSDDAFCKSWACNSGTRSNGERSFADAWTQNVAPMMGAQGRIDYAPVAGVGRKKDFLMRFSAGLGGFSIPSGGQKSLPSLGYQSNGEPSFWIQPN